MRDGQWSAKYVADIIKNEKYTGNALLQKRYVKDHLTKALVSNHGILPKYYAEGTHVAIVDLDTFEQAQEVMVNSRKKSATKTVTTNKYAFSGMIGCPHCGKKYKRKIARGKATWNCSTYLDFGKSVCLGKRIPEETLMSLTAEVLNVPVVNAQVLRDSAVEMVVPEPNKIGYALKDGGMIIKTWKDRSRSESWTEEMRHDAAKRATEQRRSGK